MLNTVRSIITFERAKKCLHQILIPVTFIMQAGSCISNLAIVIFHLRQQNATSYYSFNLFVYLIVKTPNSIRTLYKGSCMRLGEEVSTILRELADSIRNNRQFCPQTVSKNLNDALQDLDNALKSHPQLVLGSRNGRFRSPKPAVPHPDQEDTRFSFSSGVNSRGCKSVEHSGELTRKVLRPQLSMSMNTIISLEFSEALPFAAFTSLLVEMVAKLDHVMDEVEELGLIANFREFKHDDIVVTCEKPNMNMAKNDFPSYGTE